MPALKNELGRLYKLYDILFSVCLETTDYLNLKYSYFAKIRTAGFLKVFNFIISGFWKYLTFTHVCGKSLTYMVKEFIPWDLHKPCVTSDPHRNDRF